jgi:voltage-gated sodium channel type IV alpha
MAIGDETNCEEADLQTGNSGDCGSYMTGTIYLCIYLVLTFLIIVNMYIAVILENYSQASI